jgi:hypothetical protein
MRYKAILMAVLACLTVFILFSHSAQAINSKAGTSAFTFLKIGTGAKAQALGGAFVGLADDATALFYNPAGLTAKGEVETTTDPYESPQTPVKQTLPNYLTASYINYLLDFQYGFIGYARQLDSSTALGASVSYQNYGTFNRLDAQGNGIGTFGASDFALGLTYSKRLTPKISAGITGKFIYEKVESYSANGLAADLGLMYLLSSDGVSRIGLSLTNLGAQLKGLTKEHKDKLPTKIAAGISHQLVGLPFLFSGEIGKPFDASFYGALGAEFISLRPFYLRIGWNSQGHDYKTGDNNDFLGGFAGGFGLTYKSYQIDYSYSSYADLGSVHRISLEAGF